MIHIPTATIAMPELLAQLARECQTLAGEVEQLQDTISGLLSNTTVTPDLLQQAQALDHVFQHMTQLGVIVARTAEQASPRWQVPAAPVLAGVSLQALVHRLSGETHEAAVSGEMEMF